MRVSENSQYLLPLLNDVGKKKMRFKARILFRSGKQILAIGRTRLNFLTNKTKQDKSVVVFNVRTCTPYMKCMGIPTRNRSTNFTR